MAYALKINTSTGQLAQFAAADVLEINEIDARNASADLNIGNNLAATYEVVLGVSPGTGDTRVKGDLYVEGSSTVSVNETVQGDVQLGDGGGDTIDIGDPANPDTDTINVNSDLLMNGQAIVEQDFTETSPAALAAQANDYDPTNFGITDILRQDLTGSQNITGFAAPGTGDNERFVVVNIDGASDQLTLVNESASSTAANRILGPGGNDVVLDPGECAILTYDSTSSRWRVIAVSQAGTGGADTLQTAYAAGNTISVTSGNGAIQFSNTTDTTNVLELSGNNSGTLLNMTPSGSGVGLFMNNTGSGSAVQIQDSGNTVFEITAAGEVDVDPSSGQDFVVTVDGSGASMLLTNTGAADATLLEITNTGSGNALDVLDGANHVLVVDGAGAVDITPTSGQDLTLTAAGAGVVAISAAAAVTIDSTGAGVSIGAAGASDFTTSSGGISLDAAGELTFESNQTSTTTLTLSQDSYRSLVQTGTGELFDGITSIVGALNELANAIVDGGPYVVELVAGTGGFTAGDCAAQDATTGQAVQWNGNNNTNSKFIGIALNTVAATGTVRIALPSSKVVDSGATFGTIGNPLFGPDGTGRPTETPPSGTGDALKRVGWVLTSTSYILEPGPTVIL